MNSEFSSPAPHWEHTPEPSPLQPLVQPSNAIEKTRAKPVAFIIASCILITAIIVVYAILNEGTSSGMGGFSVNHHQWQQMESTHAYASSIVPHQWVESRECDEDHQFTLTLALKQSNTDNMHDAVMAVSDPKSDSYRQYWDADDVRAYFAPQQDTVDTVLQWLEQNGFTKINGRVSSRSQYGNTLRVHLTCSEANALLNTRYMFYEHAESGRSHLRVKDGTYNVPESIFEHIDFIEPTIRFPLRHMTRSIRKLETPSISELSEEVDDADTTKVDGLDLAAMRSSGSYVTPSTLYTLYGVESSLLSQLQSSSVGQSIASFNGDYFTDDDVESAWDTLGYVSGNSIDEITRNPESTASGYNSESELDTQYITSTGVGLSTTVYSIDDDEDPFTGLAEAIMDTDSPPSVVSISYGADEYELGDRYCERANDEFGKLALIGTTVLASSGDSGCLGNDNDCLDGEKYIVSFPASATYVTAVGGVEGGSSGGSTTGESAWLYSGGGFSSFFEQPSWQSNAVSTYFDSDVDFPDSDRYESGMRGVPDISAQSVDYIIVVDGEYYVVSGTSASSPVVAGMVAMINAGRDADGQSTLGFLNPTLYAVYDDQSSYDEYFNDVTSGYNEGCSADNDIGWYTASGWDPVTGCGSPKFDKLYEALLSSSRRGD